MPLPTPRKGTDPATGRVKRSRREQLIEAAEQLAAEQIPERHTIDAIERVPHLAGTPAPEVTSSVADIETPVQRQYGVSDATLSDGRLEAPITVRSYDIAAIRPSPFQPKGRPSVAAVVAVERAIAVAGSLPALVSPDGGPIFSRLDPEAARLAELAYDIAEHGVKTPVELRAADDGAHECLAGHRRVAAARLAGLSMVPAIHRGAMSNAAAAATVLRGNLHWENFTTWQEAVLVTEVQERRRGDGYHDTVRSLGAVMGWSHGKVNMLVRIRRALSPLFLATVSDGVGDRLEEVLARAPFATSSDWPTSPMKPNGPRCSAVCSVLRSRPAAACTSTGLPLSSDAQWWFRH